MVNHFSRYVCMRAWRFCLMVASSQLPSFDLMCRTLRKSDTGISNYFSKCFLQFAKMLRFPSQKENALDVAIVLCILICVDVMMHAYFILWLNRGLVISCFEPRKVMSVSLTEWRPLSSESSPFHILQDYKSLFIYYSKRNRERTSHLTIICSLYTTSLC